MQHHQQQMAEGYVTATANKGKQPYIGVAVVEKQFLLRSILPVHDNQ